MNPADRPTLVIDLDAIAANWRGLAALARPAGCAAVCKADGYGLGIRQVAPALAAAGARTFFVATADEALELRACLGPDPVIYALNGAGPRELGEFRAHRLRPVLSTPGQVADAQAHARRHGTPLACALHLDSGMNRLGLGPDDAARLPQDAGGLDAALLLSHLGCADLPDHPANARQARRFAAACAALAPVFPGVQRSLAATAGVMLGNAYHFDLVRPGIGLFGGLPYGQARPVVRIEAPILQVRHLAAGEPVGYGSSWTARGPARIATLGLGYADGIPRALGNTGTARIGEVPVPYAGRVNMDLLTLDVSGVPDAAPGTPVELLGATFGIDAMAAAGGTIAHDVLAGLRWRLRRRYVSGDHVIEIPPCAS